MIFYSAFHKTHFKSSFTETHDVIILIYLYFTIAFNGLEFFLNVSKYYIFKICKNASFKIYIFISNKKI